MLRAKQVASMYGVGLSTVWSFAKQGKLTPIKPSEKITLFSVEECDKLFSSGISQWTR